MYFMGGSWDETPLADYMEQDLPDAMKDTTISGMKMKIGVAVSQDGISWGRVEGDDHSGACMVPYNKTDPTTFCAEMPSDMPEELYCAWPDVAVDTNAANKAESFVMYYSTMTKEDKQKSIAYAISEDGFRFFKRGLCLQPDATGFDAGGCARCTVVRDATYNEDTQEWEDDEEGWTMYYEGVSPEDKKHRILTATSKDRMTWTKTGLALDVGQDEDAWDVNGVGSPHIIRMDDGNVRMYYTGQGKDGSTAIGVAKLEAASAEWAREQATFSFA